MAQLNGIVSNLSGSAGQLTFKRLNGQTIVSEKITHTTNKRTAAQQQHRMKWPNLIKMYSGISPLLNCAFEHKRSRQSDYNLFVKVNFAANKVYLTKSEAGANACVAAPYQITMGSLPSIVVSGEAGASVTDIALGSLLINSSTTVKEFSLAVVTNNAGYNFGDKISFIRVNQTVNPVTGYPQCEFIGECIVLDKLSEQKLRDCVSTAGFSAKEGFLGCALGSNFQGAYAWVHSRKISGDTVVSTQALTIKNALYEEYITEDAYQRAVATYGGEHSNFLTPETNSLAASGAGSGSGNGAGNGAGTGAGNGAGTSGEGENPSGSGDGPTLLD